MVNSVGLGLVVNVLFWTLAVLVATGLCTLAAIEWFPGREQKTRSGGPKPRARVPDTRARAEEDAVPGRYRKAS